MSAMDVVMSTVDLDEETIDQLVANSAYGAKILETVRTKLVERFDGLSRIRIEDVLSVVENEIDAYHQGALRSTWLRAPIEPMPAKHTVKDKTQA